MVTRKNFTIGSPIVIMKKAKAAKMMRPLPATSHFSATMKPDNMARCSASAIQTLRGGDSEEGAMIHSDT